MQLANDGLHLLDLTTSVYIIILDGRIQLQIHCHVFLGKMLCFIVEVDYNLVKAIVHKGEVNSIRSIEPEFIFDDPKIYMKQLVSKLAGKMTKSQWKSEQQSDPEIGLVLKLVTANQHLQYKFQKDDNPSSRIILHFRDNLKLVDGLLYHKWIYKNEVTYLQFVLPCSFRKRTVILCHDQFGHLGMDKALILLQERFFWPKMNGDV